MSNITATPMESKFKDIINEAYSASMNHTATDEQELIWRLANAVHCTRVKLMMEDDETARKILYEHDYSVGRNWLLETN